MTIDQMSVDQMSMDQMSMDRMSMDQMSASHEYYVSLKLAIELVGERQNTCMHEGTITDIIIRWSCAVAQFVEPRTREPMVVSSIPVKRNKIF